MKHRVADISTRFRVEGLAAAQQQIVKFSRDVGRNLRDMNVQRTLGMGPTSADLRAFDNARKEVKSYEDWWGKQLADQEKKAAAEAAKAAQAAAKARAEEEKRIAC